jgi:hypothetical protein
MRFKKLIRSPYEDTRRKRLAALRSQQRERDRFPLLAEHIGAQQPDLDSIMAKRTEQWEKTETENRQYQANKWREARRLLETFNPDTRRAIRFYWNSHRWLPGNPSYFIYVLKSVRNGHLVRHGETLKEVSTTIPVSQAIDRIEGPAPAKPPLLPGLRRIPAKQ